MGSKPRLFIMLGLPGSGKSYFGSRLAERIDAVWLNSDKIRTEMYGKDRERSPYQNPTMSDEKLMKHKGLIELPRKDELTITIDGTEDFSHQYASFSKQLGSII